MCSFQSIGKISQSEKALLILKPEFAAGLVGIAGFSHLQIVWLAHRVPQWLGENLRIAKPYRNAPGELGVFATRSPLRPNNICITVASVARVDEKMGIVELWWIDAEDGSPVLDIKPYQPSVDRVRNVSVPDWCAHWPQSLEESGSFDWGNEFLH